MGTNSKELQTLTEIVNRRISEREFDLHEFLVSQGVEEGFWFYENYYFLSSNTPEILSKGTNQLVLKLSDEFVAKTKYEEFEKLYVLNTSAYDLDPLFSLKALTELGLPVLPTRLLYGVNVDNNLSFSETPNWDLTASHNDYCLTGMTFIIVPNLQENGKYTVEEYSENSLRRLSNGKQIRQEFEDYSGLLKNIFFGKDQRYKMLIGSHGEIRDDPTKAISRMFFLKIDKNNLGNLVVGDPENITIYKK